MSVFFTVYDPDTGTILKSGRAPNEEAAALQGAHVLIGTKGDDSTQQVIDGQLEPKE